MEESGIISKAEKYLNKISKQELNFDNIEDFETFKSIYFTLCDNLDNLLDMRNIILLAFGKRIMSY